MSSGKYLPFCLSLNVLNSDQHKILKPEGHTSIMFANFISILFIFVEIKMSIPIWMYHHWIDVTMYAEGASKLLWKKHN